MKNHAKTASIICLAVLSVLCGAAAYKTGNTETVPEEKVVAAMSYSASGETPYCLRDCEGFVAVYRQSDLTEPVTVTDIETLTLNDNDRELLQNGITAENKTELISLLEDLGS